MYRKHTIITKKLKSNEKQNKSKSDYKWNEIGPMSTFYIYIYTAIYPRSYNVSSFITKLKQMRYYLKKKGGENKKKTTPKTDEIYQVNI